MLRFVRRFSKFEEDNLFLSAQDITFNELKLLIDSGRTKLNGDDQIHVVDVRTQDEQKQGMIPTAVPIPRMIKLTSS